MGGGVAAPTAPPPPPHTIHHGTPSTCAVPHIGITHKTPTQDPHTVLLCQPAPASRPPTASTASCTQHPGSTIAVSRTKAPTSSSFASSRCLSCILCAPCRIFQPGVSSCCCQRGSRLRVRRAGWRRPQWAGRGWGYAGGWIARRQCCAGSAGSTSNVRRPSPSFRLDPNRRSHNSTHRRPHRGQTHYLAQPNSPASSA